MHEDRARQTMPGHGFMQGLPKLGIGSIIFETASEISCDDLQ